MKHWSLANTKIMKHWSLANAKIMKHWSLANAKIMKHWSLANAKIMKHWWLTILAFEYCLGFNLVPIYCIKENYIKKIIENK